MDSQRMGTVSWPEEGGGTGSETWDLLSGGVEGRACREGMVGILWEFGTISAVGTIVGP